LCSPSLAAQINLGKGKKQAKQVKDKGNLQKPKAKKQTKEKEKKK